MKKILLILFTICAVQTVKAQYGWYMPMPDPASFAQQYMNQYNNPTEPWLQPSDPNATFDYSGWINNLPALPYVEPTPSSNPTQSSTQGTNHNHNNQKPKDCHMCYGLKDCQTCNGKGWFYSQFSTDKLDCPNCTDGKCSACGGKGYL